MRARTSQVWVTTEGKEAPKRPSELASWHGSLQEAAPGRGVRPGVRPGVGWAGRGPLLFRFIRSVRRADRMHLFLSGLFGAHGRGGPRQRLSSELGAGSATLVPRLRLPGDGRELPAAVGQVLAGL